MAQVAQPSAPTSQVPLVRFSLSAETLAHVAKRFRCFSLRFGIREKVFTPFLSRRPTQRADDLAATSRASAV
jgi:hypothetical protein